MATWSLQFLWSSVWILHSLQFIVSFLAPVVFSSIWGEYGNRSWKERIWWKLASTCNTHPNHSQNLQLFRLPNGSRQFPNSVLGLGFYTCHARHSKCSPCFNQYSFWVSKRLKSVAALQIPAISSQRYIIPTRPSQRRVDIFLLDNATSTRKRSLRH